jgi:hypothetical protein
MSIADCGLAIADSSGDGRLRIPAFIAAMRGSESTILQSAIAQ